MALRSSVTLARSLPIRMSSPFVHITDEWLRDHMPISKLLDSVEAGVECFSARHDGGVTQPLRTAIPDKGRTGHFASSIAHIDCQTVYVNKMFSHIPANAEKGLPVTQSVLAMFDSAQGNLVALVDGAELTRMHSSAVSAAASRLFAPSGSSCLALLVSDARDAEALLDAHRLVIKKLSTVHICNPRGSNEDAEAMAAALRSSTSASGLEVEAFGSVETAVASAHVVCINAGGADPVLQASWLQQPGVHVNSLGSFLPSLRELNEDVFNGACVLVDSREAALDGSGDLRAAGSSVSIAAEVGEVIGCRVKVEKAPEGRSVFCGVGLPVQDGMAARLALKTLTDAKIKDVNCAK